MQAGTDHKRKLYDIALGPSADGRSLVVHRIDCPAVRQQAADGEPVASLWGCQGLPEGLERHACVSDIMS